ncbi:GTP 3',8-cyclase MoaA [Tsukamurella sputi]|uniref:GTP 3',8-cyclase n=1 Tax=Tsukamurella sputi TaxID=2591848 RepID=A0A5C5RKH1_9ACTN|nr:GTP 3',8-cyclase MoaA [Tsukamurella sputi]TWS22963.1 GTP 3',8-cyclase MoaA [Tsukamurella sputi]
MKPLVDRYGRVARDLRVSLTDRCNLRCTYCMPADGLPWLADDHVLTGPEIDRLITIGVRDLGITEIRFTGGEPLLRADLSRIVAHAASLEPRPEISLTTNGLSLARHAAKLAGAGLDRVNVSLDTVDRDEYAKVTRRDRLDDALAGLRAAADAGLTPVKVNAVLGPGRLGDARPLLRLCLEAGYELRIIEHMPLDADHTWERTTMITAEQILAELRREFTITPDGEPRGSAPAERFLVDGGPSTVGVIASVTRPFCGDCDRVRLTADGQIRTCLFAAEETDLKPLLRGGASDEQIAEAWLTAMLGKQAGHGIDDPTFLQPARPMSAIGG